MTTDVEQVQRISTRLLEILLAEFPCEPADIVLVGIVDAGIKTAKVCGVADTNVECCDLLLKMVRNIKKAELEQATG